MKVRRGSRFGWWLTGVSSAVGAGVVAAGCGPTTSNDGFLVVERSGAEVEDDTALLNLIRGTAAASDDDVVKAACLFEKYGSGSTAIGGMAGVGTNDRLLRAGALVESGAFPARMVSEIEGLWVSGKVALDELDAQAVADATSISETDAESYLLAIDAVESPTGVVLAYSGTRWDQRLQVLPEVPVFKLNVMEGINPTVEVALPDGSNHEVVVSGETCNALLD